MTRKELDRVVRKQVMESTWKLQEKMRKQGANPVDFYSVLMFTLVSMAAFAGKMQGLTRSGFEDMARVATDEGYED